MENKKNIPVVILAGGEYVYINDSGKSTKAAVEVNGKPLIFHIISYYASYGFKLFYICLGKGSEDILKIVQNVKFYTDLSDIEIIPVFTGGLNATGSRIFQLKNYLLNYPRFAISYTDTIGDINLNELLKYHDKSQKKITLTAVNLPTRFKILGYTEDSNFVKGFSPKPILDQNLILGGFYFIESSVLNEPIFNSSINCNFENDVLPYFIQVKELIYYKHDGFWHYVDSRRDVRIVENYFTTQNSRKLR